MHRSQGMETYIVNPQEQLDKQLDEMLKSLSPFSDYPESEQEIADFIKAKQLLKALVEQRELDARIDELRDLPPTLKPYAQNRIAELQAKKGKSNGTN